MRAQVTRRYLFRQAEIAARQIEADMRRRSTWVLGAQRVLRWTGTVKHGPSTVSALDAYVANAVASSKLSGGRQGGWVVADFHRAVMLPALQALTSAHQSSGINALLSSGVYRRETTWYNHTTMTYTSELCLDVSTRDVPAALPTVRFEVMRFKCS